MEVVLAPFADFAYTFDGLSDFFKFGLVKELFVDVNALAGQHSYCGASLLPLEVCLTILAFVDESVRRFHLFLNGRLHLLQRLLMLPYLIV